MPADLSETEGCPGPVRRADPYSGAEYRVEPLAKGRYRLCAEFELPPQVPNAGWPGEMGNRDGDCIVHELPRIADRQFGNEPAG